MSCYHVRALIPLVALLCGACSRQPVPFEFVFDGETSGTGALRADMLTSDRTKGIVIHSELLPVVNNQGEAQYLRALSRDGSLDIQLGDAADGPVTRVLVYEFKAPVSGFTWHHLNYHDEIARQWAAVDGHVTIVLHRHPETGYGASYTVYLSNIVFAATWTRQRRIIESLTITNAHFGGIRM
jgi:hypothetical protein